MATIIFEGHVCVDCAMVIANGDTSGIYDLADWERRVEEIDLGLALAIAGDEEFMVGVTCDQCGDGLSGDRFPVVALG